MKREHYICLGAKQIILRLFVVGEEHTTTAKGRPTRAKKLVFNWNMLGIARLYSFIEFNLSLILNNWR